MKKIITFLIVLFAIQNHSIAQIISLSTQVAVDNFSTTYPGITTVTDLHIVGNKISNLNGLSQLTTISNNLTIYSDINTVTAINYPLTDISGLNNITTVGGTVNLSRVPNLSTTNILNSLTHAESIFIHSLMPTTVSGFNNLISARISITATTGCSIISGFSNLINCTNFAITSNQNLQNIGSFANLNQITNDFDFRFNPMLLSLPTMPLLINIGRLVIIDNESLTNLDGLESLETIRSEIQINNHPLLTDLTALSNITSFYGNNGGSISVKDNTILNNLTGLQNIGASTIGNVYIQNNPILSDCSIANFCQKIALNGISQFSNTYTNASGCNSGGEILAGCNALNSIETTIKQFYLFPNPTNSILNIQTDEQINSLKIIDISGKTTNLKNFDTKAIDVSSLATGVYFLEIGTDEGLVREKFIKN